VRRHLFGGRLYVLRDDNPTPVSHPGGAGCAGSSRSQPGFDYRMPRSSPSKRLINGTWYPIAAEGVDSLPRGHPHPQCLAGLIGRSPSLGCALSYGRPLLVPLGLWLDLLLLLNGGLDWCLGRPGDYGSQRIARFPRFPKIRPIGLRRSLDLQNAGWWPVGQVVAALVAGL